MTRLAREVVDDAEADAYRTERDEILAEYDYTARIRNDETGDVLVCHPVEWVDDGVIRPERVDDIDRGVEIRLSAPATRTSGQRSRWNRAVVDAVTVAQVRHTRTRSCSLIQGITTRNRSRRRRRRNSGVSRRLCPRNAWPTAEQRSVLDQSIRLTVEEAGGRAPDA